MRKESYASSFRFLIPVILENTLTPAIGMIFSALLGGVSASALASMGVVNSLVGFLSAAMCMLTTGSAVLTARLVGERDVPVTSQLIEQSLLLTTLFSVVVSAVILVFIEPISMLLMPNPDPVFLAETTSFLRQMMLSFPLLMLYTVLGSILRAAGLSRSVLVGALLLNGLQLALTALFLSGMQLGLLGASLAFFGCRLAGFGFLLWVALRTHTCFSLNLRRMLRPQREMLGRILRTGLPMSLDQIFVQGAYLLANTMIVGLGALHASAYQVANALYLLPQLPMTICSSAVLTLVGQALGQGDQERARSISRRALGITWVVSLAFMLLILLLREKLIPLYTQDAAVAEEASMILWHFLATCILAAPINATDNVLRVGGKVRCVMLYTILGVWALRLPLTWVLCYPIPLGIVGVLIANNANLLFRAVVGLYVNFKGKWLSGRL